MHDAFREFQEGSGALTQPEIERPVTVSVVMPAFEEGDIVGQVVAQTRQACPGAEIIVVDDGSTDDTAERARQAGAIVIRHPSNKGNGAAVKTGIRRATGDYVVLMDADGQHDPRGIADLVACFPQYDMVVGARKRSDQATWGRVVANAVFNLFASYAAGERVQDLTSGFRALKRSVARQFVYLLPNSFSYPTTLTLACLRAGFSLKYVPIRANKRVGKTKIRPLFDGVRFLLIILRIATLFSPMRVFLPVSLLFLSGGLGLAIFRLVHDRYFSPGAQLLIVAGLLMFMLGLVSEQIAALRFQYSEDPEDSG